jgi:O-antigen ligase
MQVMANIFSKIKSAVDYQMVVLVGLCIFSAAICLSVSFMEGGLIFAFLFWLFTIKKQDIEKSSLSNFLYRTPLVAPWSAYLGIAILSSLFALNSERAFAYLPSDLIKVGASIFLLCVLTKKTSKILAYFYLFGAAVSAVLGITAVLWEYFFGSGLFSRSVFVVHPVTYGELMSLALLLVIVMFVETPRQVKTKYVHLALVFVFAGALILSQSRGAMLGAAVSMIFLWIMERHARVFLTSLAAMAVLAVFLIAARDKKFAERMFSLPKAVHAKISDKIQSKQIEEGLDASSSARLIQWKTGREIIKDYPLLGVGPSNVKIVFHAYYPHQIDGQFGWGNLHSLYIHQTAERGLVGFAALAYLFISMFILAWRSARKSRNVYTVWCLCALPGFFVMNLTETSLQHAVVAMSVFLMLALAYSTAKK